MFTTPEFSDRVFVSIEELKKLREERNTLRRYLQKEVITTTVKTVEDSGTV